MAGIVWDEASKKSNGGTELLARELERRLPFNLLNHFQIFLSRINAPLAENKIRILWAHNLANDIQNVHLLKDGWSRFHKIVFVSDHQMQEYIHRYNIPRSRCLVLQNAIVPIPAHKKPSSIIRSTPQPLKEAFPSFTLYLISCLKNMMTLNYRYFPLLTSTDGLMTSPIKSYLRLFENTLRSPTMGLLITPS